MPNIESTADFSGINFASLRINKHFFRLYDCAWLSLVIHAQHFAPDLELAALTSHWDRLEELELALTVQHMLRIELGYACDGRTVRARVEINDFRVGMFEWEDNWICWESSKVGVEFL